MSIAQPLGNLIEYKRSHKSYLGLMRLPVAGALPQFLEAGGACGGLSSLTIPLTPLPTVRPTALPSTVPQENPQEVTLSPIALYGDYDERTEIGSAPEGLTCTLSGQSPDAAWVYLSCPQPTGLVWAKVAALVLSAQQRSIFLGTRIVSRAAPTAPAFSSPLAAQGTGSPQTFCADRVSVYGSTHQCADSQRAADAQADAAIGEINAAGQAQAPSTATPQPEVVAFKDSFKEAPECSPFIGYMGAKRAQCQAVYATQTAQPAQP
jgi:hypothetical protein